jgi:glycosyltransferase involved in cell wall biosynthesis
MIEFGCHASQWFAVCYADGRERSRREAWLDAPLTAVTASILNVPSGQNEESLLPKRSIQRGSRQICYRNGNRGLWTTRPSGGYHQSTLEMTLAKDAQLQGPHVPQTAGQGRHNLLAQTFRHTPGQWSAPRGDSDDEGPTTLGVRSQTPTDPAARPKVSVMLITYNHGPFIAQALDSILMQKTDFHFTINVIEDCSTDNTADIIRQYQERYPDQVFPFLNEKNIGFKVTQKNFFRGFKTLHGEYFAILEGDDYWTSPHKLQKQVDFLDQHPDYVICAHNTVKVYEDGSREPHRFLYYGKKEDGTIDDAISLRMFFHTTGILYRNVYNGVPPRQYKNKWSCDIFILISHAVYGKIYHMDEDMAVYRAHSGGRFSTMSTLDGWKFNIGGLQRYNAWLGFRFMKPFALAISKYCEVILSQSGTRDVDSLSLAQRVKYTGIKYVYLCIYAILDIPTRVLRILLWASLTLQRRSESLSMRRRLQAEIPGVEQVGGGQSVGNMQIGRGSGFDRLPISVRVMMRLLPIINRVVKVKMSDVRLPSIEAFGPHPVNAGEPFNVQPDGRSAMWVQMESAPDSQARLIFDGTALETVVDGRLVTAAVPAYLTGRPGKVPLWLESNNVNVMRVSDPVYFEVAVPAKGSI